MDLATYYDAYWESKDENVDHARQSLIVQRVDKGDFVLQVDCGLGILAKKLVDKGAKVVATDFSSVAVRRARSRGIEATRVDLDSEKLPFEDNLFSAVVSDSAVEHLFFSWIAIKECVRVLRPGGRLIILMPNIAHWRYRLWLLLGRFPYIPNSPSDVTHIRFFTLGEATSFLQSRGLKVKEVDGAACLWVPDFYPGLLRRRGIKQLYEQMAHRWPSALARDFIIVGEKTGGHQCAL